MFNGSDCVEEYDDVAKDFNGQLQEMVMKLNKELPGIQLVLSNPYDILLDTIQDPNKFARASATDLGSISAEADESGSQTEAYTLCLIAPDLSLVVIG
ncbi:hypothetical protein LWI29_011225 [Acer saccharum]|uniref:Uncharacterized protein n=1 Tax=Acer saccharum TaxID=4024 RepID=A0AA39T2V3_ACESA|nr:hypothetical protein LWI29_011225 [Acer saccharum]